MSCETNNKLPNDLGIVSGESPQSGCCGGKPTCCRTQDIPPALNQSEESCQTKSGNNPGFVSQNQYTADPFSVPAIDAQGNPAMESLILFEKKTQEMEKAFTEIIYRFIADLSNEKPLPHLVEATAVLASACVLSMRQAFLFSEQARKSPKKEADPS